MKKLSFVMAILITVILSGKLIFAQEDVALPDSAGPGIQPSAVSKVPEPSQTGVVAPSSSTPLVATAKIFSTTDPEVVLGEITFTQIEGSGVMVTGVIKNVSPGKHGLHVHDKGSCDEMGNAAGGHFNPHLSSHGFLPRDGQAKAHSGDMGNIEISETGEGIITLLMPNVYLKGEDNNFVGRAVILHEKEDDFGQPTGNAGGRIGCGTIELMPIPGQEITK